MSLAICPVINQQKKEINLQKKRRENYKIEKQIFINLSLIPRRSTRIQILNAERIILALVSIFILCKKFELLMSFLENY